MDYDMSEKYYLGLGKTKFNSSVCITNDQRLADTEIWLTERLSRKKSSGEWPTLGLKEFKSQYNIDEIKNNLFIGENRDVISPSLIEDFYDSQFPFYEFLKKSNLEIFSSKFNSKMQSLTHHDCHAYAALALSPFERALIIVQDGAGSEIGQFSPNTFPHAPEESHEECSVYLQEHGQLKLLKKRWIKFEKSKLTPGHTFTAGVGLLYETASEYIFNSSTSSGKVMGLAPFGKPQVINDRIQFQEALDWQKSFKRKSKKEWEESPFYENYCNLAASVQKTLEEDYLTLLMEIKREYPLEENLILTGGCALNCTNNAKILYQNLFNKIYITPFPGDESIGFGISHALKFRMNPNAWSPLTFENQSAYFGPKLSIPNDLEIETELKKQNIIFSYSQNVVEIASDDLMNNKIIGWFQGRSESGPRALGNRSILARPDRAGLQDYLNKNIKFRESFRPYGCSVLFEEAQQYFEIPRGFNNPYMSYAIRVLPQKKDLLREVSHIDGTSRMQTVREKQNPLFYQLIKNFGKKSNLYCLLNTSLNIMGEPIIENFLDAIKLFQQTPIDSMYIGNFVLKKSDQGK